MMMLRNTAVLFLAYAIGTISAASFSPAEVASCDEAKCLLPDCRCSSTSAPKELGDSLIPQFVFLTFDDAVNTINYQDYSKNLYGRVNPDGCPVSATFFVSHDYTDYSLVHDLYAHGQEIALHSITHDASGAYWNDISEETLTKEFGNQLPLMSTFANIPQDHFQGMRLPFLILAGDRSFKVAKEIGLSWDCSWPTQQRAPGLWPYTLDYASIEECQIGTCPEDPVPGMWEFPMIDWLDAGNVSCSMVDACAIVPNNTDLLVDLYIENFNRQYKGNRSPFGFYVHAAYFDEGTYNREAYGKFLDYLQTLPDVFLTGITRAKQWLQNPWPIGAPDWPACQTVEDTGCNPIMCNVKKGEEERWMTICGTSCPTVYPWLDDPLGEGTTTQ